MRVILFTGKGGVGKTSVAAATALRTAELGYRTIAMSTDAAHSLGDSFEIPLSGEPKLVAPNLWAQETDLTTSIAVHWGTIQSWLTALLHWRGVDEAVAAEVAILPGMEELGNLLYILSYYERAEHQVIIVDCAPTGETLRLLSFPEVLRWWIDKVLPWERRAATMLRPLAKRLLDVPFPEDKVFAATQHLVRQLERLSHILTDGEKVTVRLVVNPEKMVIKEAQRTFTYLNLYGYATDMVVCNRVLPQEAGGDYFDAWRVQQSKYLRLIEEDFSPLPIRTIPFFSQEVVGLPRLRQMAEALYGADDPTIIYFRGQAQVLEKTDGHFVLTLMLPFTAKEEIHLLRDSDELVVQVGSYRRNLILPRSLVGLAVTQARFEQNKLLIRFEEGGDGKDSGSKPHP